MTDLVTAARELAAASAPVTPAVANGLAGLAATAWGPIAGQVLLIGIGAVGGAFWTVSGRKVDTAPPMNNWVALLRLVTVSALFTSTVSTLIQKTIGWPYNDCLVVCAFMLAAFGDSWPAAAMATVRKFLATRGIDVPPKE